MAGRHGLEIRGATSADASGLAELFAAVGRAVAPRVLAERLDAVLIQPGAVLIAADWGPPCGLIAVHWRRTLEADAPVARIDPLLVSPESRRRGIARLLLKAASQSARSARCATLELSTDAAEPGLAAFCEATGFSPIGRDYARPLRKGG